VNPVVASSNNPVNFSLKDAKPRAAPALATAPDAAVEK
jgi:hypothetical protein